MTSEEIIRNQRRQLGTVGEYCVSVSKQEMRADDAINKIREHLVDHQHDVDTYDILHAHWIFGDTGYSCFNYANCSNCGTQFDDTYTDVETEYKYCPNCGARMNGVKKDG